MRHPALWTIALGMAAAFTALGAGAAEETPTEARVEWRASSDSQSMPPAIAPLSSSKDGAIISFKSGEGQASAERDVKTPPICNAISFRLKKGQGAPLSGWVTLSENPALCPEGADVFQAPLPQPPDGAWGRISIPFKDFMPASAKGGEGNKRFERMKISSFGITVYRQASAGSIIIDSVEFVDTRSGAAGSQARKNLVAGDTSFETGPGAWSFMHSPKGAASDDSTGSSGGSSLKLPSSEKSMAFSRFFLNALSENTPYTMSFYAKSDKGEKVNCIVLTPEWRYLGSKEFQTTADWTRFSFKIPPQTKPATFRIAFGGVIPPGATERQGNIWIDAVQLEEGEAPTDYEASEPLSVSASSGEPGETMSADPSRGVELKATVFNAEIPKEALPLKLSCSVKGLDGKELFNGAEELSPEPGAKDSRVFKALPAREPGYYVAEISATDKDGKLLKRHSAPFVIAPPQQAIPGDKSFFGLHIDYIPYEAARAAGVKWIRIMGAHWRFVEAEMGRMKPIVIPDYKAEGFNVLCTLDVAPPPKWAQGKAGNIPAKPDFPASFLRRAYLIPGVSCFEIQNEPDLTFKAANQDDAALAYAEMLKISYQDVKRANAKLLFNVSGVGEKFADTVFANAIQRFDVAGPHTYTFPRYYGQKAGQAIGPEDGKLKDMLLSWQAKVKAAGGKQELWIGELGWGLDIDEPFDGEFAKAYADTLARTFVIARSVPEVKRLFWFTGLGALEGGRYEYGIWTLREGLKPFPAAAAYANAASLIDGATPLPPLSDGDVKAYPFKASNGTVIAVWDCSGVTKGEGAQLKFSQGEAEVRRIDGSALKPDASGELSFEVSSSPHFVILKDSQQRIADKIASCLRQRAVNIGLSVPDIETLAITASNSLGSEFAGSVSASICLDGGKPFQVAKAQPLKIAAGGSESLQFPIKPPLGRGGGKAVFEIRGQDGQTATLTKKIAPMLPCSRMHAADLDAIDFASLREMIAADAKDQVQPPDPAVGWQGPEDLSVKAQILWDNEFLYFLADVSDDTHCQRNIGEKIWDGDSIQLAFDALNDATPNGGYDLNDSEIGIALGSNNRPVVWRWIGPEGMKKGEIKGAQAKIERKGLHTLYRLALPWAELAPLKPRDGSVFGFNFIVNDDDGAGRKFWIGPAAGIGGGKRPGLFKKFVLTE